MMDAGYMLAVSSGDFHPPMCPLRDQPCYGRSCACAVATDGLWSCGLVPARADMAIQPLIDPRDGMKDKKVEQ